MKWISFDDMMPPVGMNVVVVNFGHMAVVKWEKEYEDKGEYFITFRDTSSRYKPMWDLDYWAPVSFFNHLMPEALTEEWDWYAEHKDHKNIQKIKAMRGEDGAATLCSDLFYDTTNPRQELTQEEKDQIRDAFEGKLLSVEVPKMIQAFTSKGMPVASAKGTVLRMVRNLPKRKLVFKHKETNEVKEKDALIPLSDMDSWQKIYVDVD